MSSSQSNVTSLCNTDRNESTISIVGDRIEQARAVATLLIANGHGEDGHGTAFTLRHEVIIDTLWAVQELLQQAKDALEAPVPGVAKG